jgi:death-on-curing protein
LSVGEVLSLHAEQVCLYGGSHGLRDLAALESAVAMPQAGFGQSYLHEDLFAMAAAYVFHLVMGHPFVDGNKRAGATAAHVFLLTNGFGVPHELEDEFLEVVLGVAQGVVGKGQVAEFLRRVCVPTG